jgi:hemolysin type calcium-binding protein
MHRSPARPRGRTRRARRAAALPMVLAAVALPGAAEAATVDVMENRRGPHAFRYVAAPGEANDVRITETSDGRTIVSDSAPIRISGESSLETCRLTVAGDAICAADIEPFEVDLGDGNDVIRHQASDALVLGPFIGGIDGGAGNDTIHAGIRRNATGRLHIAGGTGTGDTVTYAGSPASVHVLLDDVPNDGHLGDLNDVRRDIEIVEGSAFGDRITGSDADERERFIGGLGNDIINGLGGTDVFHEGAVPSGSDDLNGGSGIDLVDYSQRTQGVLIDHDVSFDDGAPGENDLVDPNVNDIFGSQAADTINTSGSGVSPNVIRGFGGGDTIRAGRGNDVLDGGTGVDTLLAEDDDDTLDTADDTPDVIRCGSDADGSDTDTLNRDLQDVDATGCETVNSVGTLALARRALTAEAGKTTRLRLSWTHPQSWRKLRTVTLRLRLRERIVGRVAIRPRSGRISDWGAVGVVRKRTRLTHKGKTVTARLALRVDGNLAGQTLKAEVEATDTRGRRQLERDAATVRVAS